MVILFNFIVTLVVFFYFILKNDFVQLFVVIGLLSFLTIIYRQTLISFFNLNIKLEKLFFLEFVPILIFLLIIFLILGDEYVYTSQDALSIWGEHIKWIYTHDSLWDKNSDLIFKNNIPGVAIYEYLFVSIFGFSEKNINLSLQFLTLLTLGLTIKKITKDKFDYLIFTPISFITLPIFGYTYVDIMVDGLLASLLSLYLIIFFLFLHQKEKIYNLIFISIFLIMIKPVSIWYVIFTPFLVIGIFLIFENSINFKFLFSKILFISISLFPALFIWHDWNNYVDRIEGIREPLISYGNFLSYEFYSKFLRVISGFNSWASNGNFLLIKVLEMPFYITHIILNLITIIILKKNQSVMRIILTFIILNLFLIFNLISYLFLITFHFGDYEANNAASIGRYFGLIYVTWAILCIFFIYRNFIKDRLFLFKNLKFIIFVIIWSISITTLLISQNHFLKLGLSKDIVRDFRKLQTYLNSNKKNINVKTYFISQGDFGHKASLFFYFLSSYTKRHSCWSIKNKNDSREFMPWDCKGSIIQYLNGYTHVYVHKIDDVFFKQQRIHFSNNKIEENKLYVIKHNKDNSTKYLVIEEIN